MSFQLHNWQRDPTKQGNTLLNTDVYAYGSLCWTTKTSYIYHNSSWIIQVDVFTNSSRACAAFISNMDYNNDKRVVFHYVSYHFIWTKSAASFRCLFMIFRDEKTDQDEIGRKQRRQETTIKTLIQTIRDHLPRAAIVGRPNVGFIWLRKTCHKFDIYSPTNANSKVCKSILTRQEMGYRL
ncbi:uncharacterized protein LOC121048936 isoform X2 [Rosa chinensis]|uniref:uncharacterized protein LOC121048936 isoform X2 n=1 Tax=Rosa chinensis TaxID=74649 RepID=UPI001AD912F0|nr:uncharacterized protein LOC121048936 isoform X2 [Rosa chinensis]XP_040370196.1 uncharacterized protein LOC121048936 isoform X2 [Rosa chinensis]XP_040370197.1 uncharacterized protein LOC121048936 isoform X2 [Rosa chinensis]